MATMMRSLVALMLAVACAAQAFDQTGWDSSASSLSAPQQAIWRSNPISVSQ